MHRRPNELLVAAWTQVATASALLLSLGIFTFTSSGGLSTKGGMVIALGLGGLLLIQYPLWLNASRSLSIFSPLVMMALVLILIHSNQGGTQRLWLSGVLGLWLLGTLPALLSPRFHLLLLNPNMRWWLNAPRKKLQSKVVLSTAQGHCLLSSTQDISRTGAFIPMSQAQFDELELMLGEGIQLRLWLQDRYEDSLDLKAKVVRHGYGSDWTKPGLGLQFINTDPSVGRELERLTNSLD